MSSNFNTEIKTLFSYLNKLSKSKVVLFAVNSTTLTSKYYMRCFKNLADKFGIKIIDIIYDNNGLEESWNSLKSHLPNIEVITCYNTSSAVFLKRKLEKTEFSIPEDLFIISRGDKELALLEGLTSIQWNESELARQNVNLFLNLRKNQDVSSINYTLKHEFLINKSTDFITYENHDNDADIYIPTPKLRKKSLNGYLSVDAPLRFIRSCDKSDYIIIKGIINGETLVNMSFKTYLSEGAISHRISSYLQRLELDNRKDLYEFLTANKDFINKYITSNQKS